MLDQKIEKIVLNTEDSIDQKTKRLIELLDDEVGLEGNGWLDDDRFKNQIKAILNLKQSNEILSSLLISKFDNDLSLDGNGWYSDSYEWFNIEDYLE